MNPHHRLTRATASLLVTAAMVLASSMANATLLCVWLDDTGRTQMASVVPDRYKTVATCADSQNTSFPLSNKGPRKKPKPPARTGHASKPPNCLNRRHHLRRVSLARRPSLSRSGPLRSSPKPRIARHGGGSTTKAPNASAPTGRCGVRPGWKPSRCATSSPVPSPGVACEATNAHGYTTLTQRTW